MSTEDATYVLAHREGIQIAKYLTSEETARVRGLIAQLQPSSGNPVVRPGGGGKRAAVIPRLVHVSIASLAVEKLPGLTAMHAKEAKLMAEKVFPALYVFENSLRDIIERVLKAAYGASWWEQVAKPLRDKAKTRKEQEAKDHWHDKRGDRDLDYLDVKDLADIVKHPKLWPHFSSLFPRDDWVENLVEDLNVSRRVIAHMSALSADDTASVENTFRKWVRQLQGVEGILP